MVAKSYPLPAKLREDAIVEALLEVRFDTTTIPEVLAGRFIESTPWLGFKRNRLPASDMPQAFRRMDPALRFMPEFELVEDADPPRRLVRFGSNLLSFHRVKGYVGWAAFRPELEEAVDVLFSRADAPTVTRVGLRYINVFTQARHGVAWIHDLDLGIRVADAPLQGQINLNYIVGAQPNLNCKVGIATPGFVQGVREENWSVYIDLDVFTPEGFKSTDAGTIKQWITAAHEVEKAEFFSLLTTKTIEALRAS